MKRLIQSGIRRVKELVLNKKRKQLINDYLDLNLGNPYTCKDCSTLSLRTNILSASDFQYFTLFEKK